MTSSFILNDKLAKEKLIGFISDADMDMIAHLLGVAFGGECYVKTLIKKEEDGKEYFDAVYEFTPNKDYGGEFGELVKGEE